MPHQLLYAALLSNFGFFGKLFVVKIGRDIVSIKMSREPTIDLETHHSTSTYGEGVGALRLRGEANRKPSERPIDFGTGAVGHCIARRQVGIEQEASGCSLYHRP